jgi:multiple sugar transport system ATP-binding protein
MNFGDIQQIGSPHEVYHYPANLFVARFIGSPGMNFIPGKVEEREGSLGVVIDSSYFLPLGEEQRMALQRLSPPVRQVVLGVRPENILVVQEAEKVLDGEVYVFEPLGVQNVVTFRVLGYLLKALLPGDRVLRVGERVALGFREVRVFNAETEKLIA